MSSRKARNNLLLCLSSVFLAGCAVNQQVVKREYTRLNTLKATVNTVFNLPSGKIKKKSYIAAKDDKFRFEIKGFFNEPYFMLVSDGQNVKAYSVPENVFYNGSPLAAGSTAAQVFLKFKESIVFNEKGRKADVVFSPVTVSQAVEYPRNVDISMNQYNVSFVFIEAETNMEIDDNLFELVKPKSAKAINDIDFSKMLDGLR